VPFEHVHEEHRGEDHSHYNEDNSKDYVIHFVDCGVLLSENPENGSEEQERIGQLSQQMKLYLITKVINSYRYTQNHYEEPLMRNKRLQLHIHDDSSSANHQFCMQFPRLNQPRSRRKHARSLTSDTSDSVDCIGTHHSTKQRDLNTHLKVIFIWYVHKNIKLSKDTLPINSL
jgi:hypothetical protein